MPAAILIGGLVAIALAFAAISADLLIRNLVINPIKATAVAAGEVAVVGGVIAWILTQLVNLIEVAIAPMAYLSQIAQKQAADWWNYLVYATVIAQFQSLWNYLIWLMAQQQAIVWLESTMPALWSFVHGGIWPAVTSLYATVGTLTGYVYGTLTARVGGIGDDLAGLHRWIDGYELPLIRGIGDDLAGLHRWIDANVATRSQVAQAEAQAVAAAQALVVPITAAVTAIEDSPCMQYCSPLGDLGQFLQGLEDAGMLAIILALIAEARVNPGQVAADIHADLAAPLDDILKSLSLGIPS